MENTKVTGYLSDVCNCDIKIIWFASKFLNQIVMFPQVSSCLIIKSVAFLKNPNRFFNNFVTIDILSTSGVSTCHGIG